MCATKPNRHLISRPISLDCLSWFFDEVIPRELRAVHRLTVTLLTSQRAIVCRSVYMFIRLRYDYRSFSARAQMLHRQSFLGDRL